MFMKGFLCSFVLSFVFGWWSVGGRFLIWFGFGRNDLFFVGYVYGYRLLFWVW